MKTLRRYSAVTGIALLCISDLGVSGEIYQRITDAPRPTKTPKNITLSEAPGSEKALTINAQLVEIRSDRKATAGFIGKGNLNVFRKFVRLEIVGATDAIRPALVKVTYSINEGQSNKSSTESITIPEPASKMVVDINGFEDETGTSVEDKSGFSYRYRHFNAEINEVSVSIFDALGNQIYAGAWPKPSNQVTQIPHFHHPRTFTNSDGRKIDAKILDIIDENISIESNGKKYLLPVSTLSLDDQAYIKEWLKFISFKPTPSQSPTTSIPTKSDSPKNPIPAAQPLSSRTENANDDYRLIGLKYWVGDLDGSRPKRDGGINVIIGVQGIFLTKDGKKVDGTILGKSNGVSDIIEAKAGFAVGGIDLATGIAVDRFKLIFFRLEDFDSGFARDRKDRYESDWCGGKGGTELRPAISDGLVVTGLGFYSGYSGFDGQLGGSRQPSINLFMLGGGRLTPR